MTKFYKLTSSETSATQDKGLSKRCGKQISLNTVFLITIPNPHPYPYPTTHTFLIKNFQTPDETILDQHLKQRMFGITLLL